MFERIFAPASIDSLFSDTAMLAAMARFENGLAQAQASVGMIPDEAARAIGMACHEECRNANRFLKHRRHSREKNRRLRHSAVDRKSVV